LLRGGFKQSSGLEIEITEPEGTDSHHPEKGREGGKTSEKQGATGPEEEPVPVNKH